MKIRQIGKAIASVLLAPLALAGSEGVSSNYNSKIDVLREIQKERAVEDIVREKKSDALRQVQKEKALKEVELAEKYKKAVYFGYTEGIYEDGSKIYDMIHGTVVGKEYVTVEHWTDFPEEFPLVFEKNFKGYNENARLIKRRVFVNGRELKKVLNFREISDRGLYELPKGLSWLENDLKIKDKTDLKVGDEVFWWGNARGVFFVSGEPEYCEARVTSLPWQNGREFIMTDRAAIPGDSGSLMVKKKTGEIVGVVARRITDEEIGLIIPAQSYLKLREPMTLVENAMIRISPQFKFFFTKPNFPAPPEDYDKPEYKLEDKPTPQFKYSDEEIKDFIRNHPIR